MVALPPGVDQPCSTAPEQAVETQLVAARHTPHRSFALGEGTFELYCGPDRLTVLSP